MNHVLAPPLPLPGTVPPPMTLTPELWTWRDRHPRKLWLNDFPAAVPVVWQAWLTDDAAVLSHLTSLLSAEERARMERFRMSEDRQRFLVGRGLLRLLAGAQLDLPPESLALSHGPFGKPCLIQRPGAPALHFNVSHSGKLVLLAFHPVHEVGVDVEEVRAARDWQDIAERVFSADEKRRLDHLNPEEWLAGFFQTWTRHEARLKSLGLGFSDENHSHLDAQLVCADLALPEGYRGAVGCLRA